MELHLYAFLTQARDGEDVGEGSGTLLLKKGVGSWTPDTAWLRHGREKYRSLIPIIPRFLVYQSPWPSQYKNEPCWISNDDDDDDKWAL